MFYTYVVIVLTQLNKLVNNFNELRYSSYPQCPETSTAPVRRDGGGPELRILHARYQLSHTCVNYCLRIYECV